MSKIYNWEGFEGNTPKSGLLEAESQDKIVAILSRQNIVVTNISEVQNYSHSEKSQQDLVENYKPKRIKNKDKVLFTKKLATMVKSGLPILKTLKMLEEQAENKNLKLVIKKIRVNVEGGSSISEAFADHPQVFDQVYINLLKAGESSGKLTVFLERLVINLEKVEKIRRKVKSALMYPTILMCVAISVILLMLIKVVPVFQSMFSAMGHDLPGPTKAIISISEFIRSPSQGGLLFAIIFISIFVFNKARKKSPNLRMRVDRNILKIPLIGDVIIKSTLAKIAMVSANLSSAGVSVIESLGIISKTVSNTVFLQAFEEIKKGVAEGKPLSKLYSANPVFPPTFHQMISVGEETGRLDDMLNSLAGYYEEEFDLIVDRLTELLEPIMIVFMGITVGFIIVAMYMPIFQIGNAVQ